MGEFVSYKLCACVFLFRGVCLELAGSSFVRGHLSGDHNLVAFQVEAIVIARINYGKQEHKNSELAGSSLVRGRLSGDHNLVAFQVEALVMACINYGKQEHKNSEVIWET